MKTITLEQYGPIISDSAVGDEILHKILDLNPKEEEVEVDMESIVSMTTFCAKQIFGALYNELGAALFERHILLKNVSSDVLLIIKMGIRNAVVGK